MPRKQPTIAENAGDWWFDKRKRHLVGVKLDEEQKFMLETMAKEMGISEGEMIRRAILTTRVLYDPGLTIDKALRRDLDEGKGYGDTPLSDILKPIPQLAAEVGLSIKLWGTRASLRLPSPPDESSESLDTDSRNREG